LPARAQHSPNPGGWVFRWRFLLSKPCLSWIASREPALRPRIVAYSSGARNNHRSPVAGCRTLCRSANGRGPHSRGKLRL
jgi:hypothetical protein